MPSSYTNLLYHVVFSTKYRHPMLASTWREELNKYVAGILRNHEGALLELNGMPDHVHLLMRLSPKLAVADVLRLVKANSSKWINDGRLTPGRFEWQTGYAAFSVSQSQVEKVQNYIQTQEEHHRVKSFREEYLEMLTKHNIPYDERYVFEDEYLA